MAIEANKLDVEIDDRRYGVVSDKLRGVALEPAITRTVAEIRAEHGGRPLSSEEFEQLFGDLPSTPSRGEEALGD